MDEATLQQSGLPPGLIYNILQQPVLTLDVSVLQQPMLPLDLSVLQQLVALYCLKTCMSYGSLQVAASGRIDSATAYAFLDVSVLQHVQLCTSLFCAASGRVSSKAACTASGRVCPTAACTASGCIFSKAACAVFGHVSSGFYSSPAASGLVCSIADSAAWTCLLHNRLRRP
jgi:hypothetical protein